MKCNQTSTFTRKGGAGNVNAYGFRTVSYVCTGCNTSTRMDNLLMHDESALACKTMEELERCYNAIGLTGIVFS
jgi:hypothetical protein